MSDFNIDINSPTPERDKLDELYTLFDFKSLITSETCITKTKAVLLNKIKHEYISCDTDHFINGCF